MPINICRIDTGLRLSRRAALVGSMAGAALTALCAQAAIPLPGFPVPVTLQVLAVVMCGMLLGSRWAAVAQAQYLVAGLLGAPVFAMFKSGPALLAGPTAGYALGFIPAAFFTGLFLEKCGSDSLQARCFAGLIGVGVIYLCGVTWLSIWGGSAFPGWIAWAVGAAPFAGADMLKVLLAAKLSCGIGRHVRL